MELIYDFLVKLTLAFVLCVIRVKLQFETSFIEVSIIEFLLHSKHTNLGKTLICIFKFCNLKIRLETKETGFLW